MAAEAAQPRSQPNSPVFRKRRNLLKALDIQRFPIRRILSLNHERKRRYASACVHISSTCLFQRAVRGPSGTRHACYAGDVGPRGVWDGLFREQVVELAGEILGEINHAIEGRGTREAGLTPDLVGISYEGAVLHWGGWRFSNRIVMYDVGGFQQDRRCGSRGRNIFGEYVPWKPPRVDARG